MVVEYHSAQRSQAVHTVRYLHEQFLVTFDPPAA